MFSWNQKTWTQEESNSSLDAKTSSSVHTVPMQFLYGECWLKQDSVEFFMFASYFSFENILK